jgi:phosphate transport system protein
MTQGATARRQLDADLEGLQKRVLEMGALAGAQLQHAVAVLEGRAEAREVEKRDRQLDALELAIDDACAHVIAKRQPAAGDLRLILGISKMVSELERIGDKARKIARLSAQLQHEGFHDAAWASAVSRLAGEVSALLKDGLSAFMEADIALAVKVIRRRRDLSATAGEIGSEIVRKMVAHSAAVPHLLKMLNLTRAIDRASDHAGDFAEHLIYVFRGTDVRHATLEEIEREAGGA